MTDTEFFEILGYLSSPARNTKLDAETHPRRQNSFESRYQQITGIRPIVDDHNYYVWPANANKWGLELRIYFNRGTQIPAVLQQMTVRPRQESFGYDSRVNKNLFIWRLIEQGFLLQDGQNLTRVRGLVPANYSTNFNHGLIL